MGKKIIVYIIISLVFLSMDINAFNRNVFNDAMAAESQSYSINERKNMVYDYYVAYMNLQYGTKVVRAATKSLKDFDGNEYVLVECDPTGYLIYSESSGNLMEYSATSPSPFSKFKENMYYGGPSSFIVLKDNDYYHTVTNEKCDSTMLPQMKEVSKRLHLDDIENKNLKLLDYISNGGGYLEEKITNQSQKKESIVYTTFSYVTNYTFFSSLTGSNLPGENGDRMGYVPGGYCGFIGANILIAYYGTFRDSAYLTGTSIVAQDSSGIYRIKNNSLTQTLITTASNQCGYTAPNGTIASQMKTYVLQYFSNMGINKTCYYKLVPTATRIKNYIAANIPVELYGELYDPSGGIISNWSAHAVVVYGYCNNSGNISSRFGFQAHYGWDGYANVTFNTNSGNNGVFGSMFTFEET